MVTEPVGITNAVSLDVDVARNLGSGGYSVSKSVAGVVGGGAYDTKRPVEAFAELLGAVHGGDLFDLSGSAVDGDVDKLKSEEGIG